MTLQSVVQQLVSESLSGVVRRLPPLQDDEILGIESRYGVTLGRDLRELLRFSSGIEAHGLRLDFSGKACMFSFPDIKGIPMLGDGMGNFWITILEPDGSAGEIVYFSHDPPVVIIHFSGLECFVREFVAKATALLADARRMAELIDIGSEPIPSGGSRLFRISDAVHPQGFVWESGASSVRLHRLDGGKSWVVVPD